MNPAERLELRDDGTPSQAEQELRAQLPLDLGDELQLRFGERRDIDGLVEILECLGGKEAMAIWNRDNLEGRHPNVSYRDFTLVEDVSTGRIVSAMSLISQTWSYGGIPFGCGQPEMVVTDPDYRRRGLVRRQIDVVHELSAARGELMQIIWGKPWYYRMFGYEYAMNGEWGMPWLIHAPQIPALAEGETEPYILRPIRQEDYEFVRRLQERGAQRGLFAAVKDDRDWAFYFEGYSPGAMKQFWWYTICDHEGKAIGFLTLHDSPWWNFVDKLELAPGYAYLQVLPSVLRQVQQIEPVDGPASTAGLGRPTVQLHLPPNHPAARAIEAPAGNKLWYIRIPDVVEYLRHIRPALEANLVGTEAEGFSGELNINCFRWGLQMRLERGRITAIEPWRTDDLDHRPMFPDLTLLQVICGSRRCAELMAAFPDCRVSDADARLLDCLFPTFHGGLWLGN